MPIKSSNGRSTKDRPVPLPTALHPPPLPAQPQTIALGESIDEVTAILGQPPEHRRLRKRKNPRVPDSQGDLLTMEK